MVKYNKGLIFMRINSVRLREIKESIEEHLEKCKIYQKEYYYMSEELFLNWKSLKANYYKDLLIKEKNSNEKTIYKVEQILINDRIPLIPIPPFYL